MGQQASDHLVAKLFCPADDLAFTVLRGYLFVQQRFIAGLERRFPHPEALKLQGQPFSQLVQMARAFTDRQDNGWLWKAILALNEARTHLAHNLDASDLPAKVEHFLRCVGDVHPISGRTLHLQLQHAIAWVCGNLESRHLWAEKGTHGP
jgi:hypothetical protein